MASEFTPQSTPLRDMQLAYLLLRLTLGLNILLHGLSRILAGPSHFAASLVPEFAKTPLADWAVYDFGLILPWAEGLLGLLLLLGLVTRWTLVAGSLLMLTLTFGTTLRQDWPSAGLQLIYSIVYAALLAFRSLNLYSVDSLLHRNSKPQVGFSAVNRP